MYRTSIIFFTCRISEEALSSWRQLVSIPFPSHSQTTMLRWHTKFQYLLTIVIDLYDIPHYLG